MRADAPRGDKGAGWLWILPLVVLLTGCAGDRSPTPAPPSEPFAGDYADAPDAVPLARVAYLDGHPHGDTFTSPAAALEAADPSENCDIGKRFDRGSTLSFQFDEQSRLGFNMKVKSGFGNPFEVRRAMLVFHYSFHPVKTPQERCQYASRWQGLAGSGYNELVLRQHNSVWSALHDRGLDFWKH